MRVRGDSANPDRPLERESNMNRLHEMRLTAETKVGFIDMLGHDSEYFSGASPIASMAADFDAVFASRNE